MAVRREFKF